MTATLTDADTRAAIRLAEALAAAVDAERVPDASGPTWVGGDMDGDTYGWSETTHRITVNDGPEGPEVRLVRSERGSGYGAGEVMRLAVRRRYGRWRVDAATGIAGVPASAVQAAGCAVLGRAAIRLAGLTDDVDAEADDEPGPWTGAPGPRGG